MRKSSVTSVSPFSDKLGLELASHTPNSYRLVIGAKGSALISPLEPRGFLVPILCI